MNRSYPLLVRTANPGSPLLPKRCARGACRQHEGGGWSQLANLSSDTYATAEALCALKQAGAVPATAAEYQRGWTFSDARDFEDGSSGHAPWRFSGSYAVEGVRYIQRSRPHALDGSRVLFLLRPFFKELLKS